MVCSGNRLIVFVNIFLRYLKQNIPEMYISALLENEEPASLENAVASSWAPSLYLIGKAMCLNLFCFSYPVADSSSLLLKLHKTQFRLKQHYYAETHFKVQQSSQLHYTCVQTTPKFPKLYTEVAGDSKFQLKQHQSIFLTLKLFLKTIEFLQLLC
ncbi:hypothetical protein Cgig2_019801 [Carnegiea gigantea]|uniref:Uncharacterized protein n=1 Tax=Carnegiea gigantea TaxID=171969 RepID=A0A9Q1JZ18_9CARY|nr:hypothetical protein Cgig2_019801 [Carnegiea gigantea]